MNEDVKRAWVQALRSGKYKQRKGRLAHAVDGERVGHCCLGVLCELAIEGGVTMSVKTAAGVGDYTYFGHEAHHLPEPVQNWAGLGYNPKVTEKDLHRILSPDTLARLEGEGQIGRAEDCDVTTLSALNDSLVSFEEIAQIIEGAELYLDYQTAENALKTEPEVGS